MTFTEILHEIHVWSIMFVEMIRFIFHKGETYEYSSIS